MPHAYGISLFRFVLIVCCEKDVLEITFCDGDREGYSAVHLFFACFRTSVLCMVGCLEIAFEIEIV